MENSAQTLAPADQRTCGRITVAKAGAYAAGTNVIQVIGGLVATALLARLLGPAQKGIYDLYLASSMLLSVLLGFALNAGVTYVVASEPVNTSRLMRVLALIALAEASLALGLTYAANALGFGGSIVPTELGAWRAPLVALTVCVLAMAGFYRAVLVGHREFISANYGDVGKQVLGVGFILLAVVTSRLTRLPLVHAVVLANTAAVGITILLYGSRVPRGPATNHDTGLARAFRFSLPSYFASASQYLNNRVDLFFVYRYWGAAHVGLYQTAVLIAQAINLLPMAMQAILFPTIASGSYSHEETVALVARTHRLFFTVGVATAGTLAVVGPVLIPMVFGKRFGASAVSLALLAPGCALFVTTNILAAYFAGTGRPHINLVNSVVGTGVTVALDLLVVPRWSFYGASVVMTLSCAVTTASCLIVFQRETGTRLVDLYVLTKSDLALGGQYCRNLAARWRSSA